MRGLLDAEPIMRSCAICRNARLDKVCDSRLRRLQLSFRTQSTSLCLASHRSG